MSDLDDGAQSGADPTQSGGGNEPGNTNGSNNSGRPDPDASGAGGTKETEPTGRYSEEDMEQVRNRMRAADQRASQFEAELRKLRDKDLPEMEKAQRDLAELGQERDKLKEQVRQQSLENAFLKDNKYKWKNPAAALKLADLGKVEVHDDGAVTGLTQALDALAKSDPYLLEDEAKTKDGETKGSTGVPGTNGRQSDTKSDLKKMAVRMPALRSRGIGT